MLNVCVHSWQTKKKKIDPLRHDNCVYASLLSLSFSRRLFVLNEQIREKERCSTSRLSLNYTVCSFVLSLFSSFSCSLFPSRFFYSQGNGKWNYAIFSHFFFFNYTLVIYDGGRHPIEIARRNICTHIHTNAHGRSSPFFSLLFCSRVGLDKTNI